MHAQRLSGLVLVQDRAGTQLRRPAPRRSGQTMLPRSLASPCPALPPPLARCRAAAPPHPTTIRRPALRRSQPLSAQRRRRRGVPRRVRPAVRKQRSRPSPNKSRAPLWSRYRGPAPRRPARSRRSLRYSFCCFALSRGARDQLRDRRACEQHEQPDADQLQPVAQAPCLREQSEYDETEAEIVRFGERVQTRQCVGKAKQANGAGQKKERTRRYCRNRHHVACEAHLFSSVDRGPSVSRMESPFLTNAMDANVARSAKVNATSTAAGTPV